MKIRCVVNTVFNQLGSQTTEKSLPVWMIFSVVCLLTVFPRSDADAGSSSSRGSPLSRLHSGLWTNIRGVMALRSQSRTKHKCGHMGEYWEKHLWSDKWRKKMIQLKLKWLILNKKCSFEEVCLKSNAKHSSSLSLITLKTDGDSPLWTVKLFSSNVPSHAKC